jgi:UDP-N-acetylmuramate dehydrogenase
MISLNTLQHNVILKPYSTFKMGGPAEYYMMAEKEEDLIEGIKFAHEAHMPVRVLGGASNIVISDAGIKGLVIRNMVSSKEVLEETETSVLVRITSGYSMTRLAKETAEAGWSGFEHHLGLPGTLGGALFMNSKWVNPERTYYVGDTLVRAQLVTREGETRIVDKEYFDFGYDYSTIQKTGEIVVWAEFSMMKDDPEKLIQQGKDALAYRKQTQPFGVSTSGCFFKNVNGESAGKMIDQLGLKGHRIGGAFVSDVHANFILNDGTATTHDVEELLADIKKKVKDHYNVELEQEVSII